MCGHCEILVSEHPADDLTETAETEAANFAQPVGGISASYRQPNPKKGLVVVADSKWAMEEFRRDWVIAISQLAVGTPEHSGE